jgi:hypothetical protein
VKSEVMNAGKLPGVLSFDLPGFFGTYVERKAE